MGTEAVSEFLGDNKMLIVAGIGGIGVLWFLLRGHAGSASQTVAATGASPVQNAQASAIGTQAAAMMTAAQAKMVEAQGIAQSNTIRAQNQTVLASYLAGTTIADTALQNAGREQVAGLLGAASASRAYSQSLQAVAGASSKTIQSVSEANAQSSRMGFSFGLPGVGSVGMSI